MLPHKVHFNAIGTSWQIDTAIPIADQLKKKIAEYIESYDKSYSRFRSDSMIANVAKKAGTYTFPDHVIPLVSFYRSLYGKTNGKVTPLIGAALDNAGYDAEYSFITKGHTDTPAWDEVMTWQNATVTTTTPITLDFGAAGKGYLVDKIGEILREDNHSEYVIDASGDLLHAGSSKNIVGLEHPIDQNKIIGTISVQNASLCASATNRRIWAGDMHHIFDPTTNQPTRNILATWVIAKNTMIADGLATALFFVNPKHLSKYYDFQFVRMYDNSTIDYSARFNGELYI